MAKFFDRDEIEDVYFSALRDEDRIKVLMEARVKRHIHTRENTLGISIRPWHYVFVYDYVQQGSNPHPPSCFGPEAVRIGSCVTASRINRLVNTTSPGLVFLSQGNGQQRVGGELWRVSGDTILDMDRWKTSTGYFTRQSICVKIDPSLQDNKNHTNGLWCWVYTMAPSMENRLMGKTPIPTTKIHSVGEVAWVEPIKQREIIQPITNQEEQLNIGGMGV